MDAIKLVNFIVMEFDRALWTYDLISAYGQRENRD